MVENPILGPAATGFALALKYKKKANIVVSFFGEGAINQGMMLESMNLASILNLPVLLVCKVNNWAISTITNEVIGGNMIEQGVLILKDMKLTERM